MAGTVIAPQQLPSGGAGVAPVFGAAAAQMELPNQAPTLLHLKATGAVTLTATNQTQSDAGALNPNKTLVMANGNERVIRFSPGLFNMANGNVQLAFDAPANVTVAAYQMT